MSARKTIFLALALMLALSHAAGGLAQSESDPIIRMDSSSKMELDLGVMVQDLKPRLLALIAEDSPEEAEQIGFLLDLIGLDALDILKAESRESKDHSEMKVKVTFDPDKAESLLARLYTAPNGKCEFGSYLNKDDMVMFVSMQSFSHWLETLFDFMAQPEIAELMGDMPVNGNGDLDLGGFVPRTDLLPLLSGEADIFILDAPEGTPISPMTVPYFMVLGSTDGFALRDMLLGLASSMGGEEGGGVAAMLESIEPEMIGDFEMKATPFGVSFAVSEDFFVVGMVPDLMREILGGKKGGMKVPEGLEYAYIDGPKYGQFMESVMGMAAMMEGEDDGEMEMLMDVYGVLFQHIHREEILYRSRGDHAFEAEIEVDGPVLTGLYRLLPTLLDKVPEMIAMEKAKEAESDYLDEYRQSILVMDAAMTAYAADHGGIYPEDPTDLYREGYIEDWPFVADTPAGEYSDWSYTYHKYHDADGAVNGYIFFVYGGGEGLGHDVYTAENLAAGDPFQIDRDGAPDGVVTFCYDGVALKMVEEYFNR